jgi:hypothetical protein
MESSNLFDAEATRDEQVQIIKAERDAKKVKKGPNDNVKVPQDPKLQFEDRLHIRRKINNN